MIAPFPRADFDGRNDDGADGSMRVLQAVISAARTMRAEHELKPSVELPVLIRTDVPETRELLEREKARIVALTRSSVRIEPTSAERPKGCAAASVEGIEVLAVLKGLVEAADERARLTRAIAKGDKDIQLLEKKLANPAFVEKAPADVVEKDKARVAELRQARERLVEALALCDEL